MTGFLRRLRERRLLAATAGALALGVAGLTIAVLNESLHRARRAEVVAAQADVLAATVAPALVFEDPSAARDAVAALDAAREIEAAGIYDARGVLQARFSRDGAEPPAAAAPGRPLHRNGRVAAAVPVRHEGEAIGTVYLRTTRDPAAAVLGRHGPTVLLLVTAFLVVAAMGAAQRALRTAAQETEARAAELARLNARLEDQMAKREKAEAALLQSQKMDAVGQLTGGIAHDFNNLLQAVRGSLDLIRRQADNADKVRRWAENGYAAAERGAKLTAQLLAFSRAQKMELRPVVPTDIVDGMRELLTGTLGAAVQVRFDLSGGREPVLADPTQLELAILNLAINARDAMPNGGRLTVSVRSARFDDDPELSPGDYVVVAVTDTGVGMPEDVRARAFDPFFTTKGVGKGTGLGLAQVYGIARQGGGAARIESRPGHGTTVCLVLPLVRAQVAAERADPAPQAEPIGAGQRVLVVDDDGGVRTYLTEALEAAGYRVDTAEDGAAALATLARGRPDLLILDFAMPGMTGAELAKAVRAQHPGVPILFASGYAETAALEAAAGPCRMLRKPFATAELARAVREALAEPVAPIAEPAPKP